METEVPVQVKSEVISEEKGTPAKKPPRERNFSFLHKKPDTLDDVEVNGITFKIPAPAGSCYWAVLKVAYESCNQPVYFDDLCNRVAELMQDRDKDRWDKYINKVKENRLIAPWKERVIGNAKTMTRSGGKSAYGLRLIERGHCLRQEYDSEMRPYFILRTNLDAIKKRKDKDVRPISHEEAVSGEGESPAST